MIALIGSGVGACVVTDGGLYGGAHSSAGEWGHTVLQVGGRALPLRCERLPGGVRRRRGGPRALGGAGGDAGDADEETALAALLRAGRRRPTRRRVAVLDETADYLGAGIADLINLFNPERIILGGWAGLLLGRHFLPAVRRSAAAYALRHPVERTTIELGRLGPDAVTVGAATLPLADFLARGGRGRESATTGR